MDLIIWKKKKKWHTIGFEDLGIVEILEINDFKDLECNTLANNTKQPSRKSLNQTLIELGLHRSEGFPARDIWFLGVILPGLDQMQRVLGTSPPPPPPSSPPSNWVWVCWVGDCVSGLGGVGWGWLQGS